MAKLSDIATFFFVMSYAAGFASMIKLRYSEPKLSQDYRAPFFPILPILFLLLSIGFFSWEQCMGFGK